MLPFPTAQEPQRLARVTLRKMPRVPVPHSPNDALQPVHGETATATAKEPEVDDAPPVVLSPDLAADRPAHADTEEEFDDPSATPLPSPMPPPFESHPVVMANGAPLEVRAPSTPATVEDDDYDDEVPSRRGLIVLAGALAIAAVAGVVFMVSGAGRDGGPTKPTTPPPTVEKKSPLPVVAAVATADLATAPPIAAPSLDMAAAPAVAAAPTDDAQYRTLLAEGKALYDKGQAKKAMVPLEKAVTLKADGDEALVLLANCFLDRGNMEKALGAAQLAIAANAENADGYLVVGAVEQQKGHNPEARTAYEKYLKLAPKGRFAGDIRSILGTLH